MNDDTLKDSKPIKGAHLGLILLIFLNILNIVDRSLIASFGTEISHDLDLTDTQFGLLVGPMFVFSYPSSPFYQSTRQPVPVICDDSSVY